MSIAEQNQSVFKGRYGYHSCDIETYRKLRVIRRHFWKEVVQFCRWQRWTRKHPHNRPVGSVEPQYAGIAIDKKRVSKWGVGYAAQQSWYWPVDRDVLAIVNASNEARMPHANPDNVPRMKVTAAQIDAVYQRVIGEA
jgi:hypothetical protein